MLPTVLDYAVRTVFFALQTFIISLALKYLIQKKYINGSALIWISTIVTMLGVGAIMSLYESLHLTHTTLGFLSISFVLNQFLFGYYIISWAIIHFKELKLFNKILKFIKIMNFVMISITYIGFLLFFVLSWFEPSLK
ncbi:hypothetical protein CN679_24615 [Bacillus pseudomycoides]|uniref:hypothetical protein n=1 Tax=Bacillus pseudomycoides TaxID=64104 RepID=UPI000BF184C3|nr:hypothetical protein [Bacillus pseudomycoides]PEI85486.1 hypothetical protein CN679_24615 [Bacillus pseudomycoides]